MFSSLAIRRLFSTALRKRFFKEVSVVSSSGATPNCPRSYEICLDHRKVKTPRGAPLTLQSESLAFAIANEWDSQVSHINQSSMSLTGLSFTAIDNPVGLTKQSAVDQILQYFDTDTLFFPQQHPDTLQALQEKHWGEWIRWLTDRFQLSQLILKESGDFGVPEICPDARKSLQRHLLAFNFWSILGQLHVAEALKSVTLTLALMDGKLGVEEAVRISNLESNYQTQVWGRFESSHDLEHFQLCSRVSAGLLFAKLSATEELQKLVKTA